VPQEIGLVGEPAHPKDGVRRSETAGVWKPFSPKVTDGGSSRGHPTRGITKNGTQEKKGGGAKAPGEGTKSIATENRTKEVHSWGKR